MTLQRFELHGYTFIRALNADKSPMSTSEGIPLFAIPGGGFATRYAIEKNLKSRKTS